MNFYNTELLFQSGNVNELELIRAESLVKDQETYLKNAEKNKVLALEKLCLNVGLVNSNSIKILGNFEIIDFDIPLLESIKSELINNQPIIKQLDANYLLLKENINSFLSEFFTSVALSGSFHKIQSCRKYKK